MFRFLTAASALIASALALTQPPLGALTVGTDGNYSNIQDAVNDLDTTTHSYQSIFIFAGNYSEQVVIPKLKGPLTVFGYSSNDLDYNSNVVTITAAHSQEEGLNNDGTATLAVHTGSFSLYNVNVANTFGKGSQAVALSARAKGNLGFYACQFTGFQDTLLAQQGNQVYARSYFEGATDFIFGQHAVVWIHKSTIGVLPTSHGWITANGRRTSSDPSYYVINNSTVEAARGQSVTPGIYYLGRPWGEYARVVFQDTELGDVVNKTGWSIWNEGDERTSHVMFGEYQNKGDGASTGERAEFSTQLETSIPLSQLIPDYSSWVDQKFL